MITISPDLRFLILWFHFCVSCNKPWYLCNHLFQKRLAKHWCMHYVSKELATSKWTALLARQVNITMWLCCASSFPNVNWSKILHSKIGKHRKNPFLSQISHLLFHHSSIVSSTEATFCYYSPHSWIGTCVPVLSSQHGQCTVWTTSFLLDLWVICFNYIIHHICWRVPLWLKQKPWTLKPADAKKEVSNTRYPSGCILCWITNGIHISPVGNCGGSSDCWNPVCHKGMITLVLIFYILQHRSTVCPKDWLF